MKIGFGPRRNVEALALGIALVALVAAAACGSKVDEAASGDVVGKIQERDLGSGKSAIVILDLSPGKYVLICNVSGHYEDGMYAGFELTAGDAPETATVGVRLGEYFVNTRASVATGSITFEVTNRGGSDHDFVVIKTDLAPAALVLW